MNHALLTRDEFRVGVFVRDGKRCVICKEEGQDAHHIIERRLWPDGGYYLANGATLCGDCHLKAESTELGADIIRAAAGISQQILPVDLYADTQYDKWGNVILENGQRLKGPLFYDESVQKIMAPVLHLFTNRYKYPRTLHLPNSPGTTEDDRSHTSIEQWIDMQVVITKKMDGENTTMYRDGLHARSLEFSSRIDRDRIRAIHGEIAYEIPENMRICGENLTAVHSIRYTDLRDWFYVYGIWENTTCLSWRETMEWCELLGMTRATGRALITVPLLFWGKFQGWDTLDAQIERLDLTKDEGLVIRPAERFELRDFPRLVGKYVRQGHVRTQAHWTRRIEFNDVKENL